VNKHFRGDIQVSDERVIISVHIFFIDHGIEINPEKPAHIFDRYYRIEENNSTVLAWVYRKQTPRLKVKMGKSQSVVTMTRGRLPD
jgi:hypothetical protein